MATGFKTGGRKAGTPNKITGEIKEVLSEFLQKEINSLPEYFSAIEPKERLEVIAKLLPYILPRQQQFLDLESDKKYLIAPKIIMTKREK